MTVGQQIRQLREAKGWSQAKLGVLSGTGPSGISQIETGRRNPSAATLQRIAGALDVGVPDLFPKAQAPLPLEEAPSLEELHAEAECATDWLVKPQDEWRAAWSQDLSPRVALRIVDEMTAELVALKPAMAEQEQGLPWSGKWFSGRYKQAWRRYFDGLEAAKACGEAHGVIGPDGTPNDMAKKLGVQATEPLDKLLLAAS